ncbi:MAG TPA: polysaccharide biosynthesis protein [Rhodobacteraceae bacterium]|nr:polysaccharide biosynthesis protein [Paracoccaceae bacterium]
MIHNLAVSLTRNQKSRILLFLDMGNAVLAFYLAWVLVIGRIPALAEIIGTTRFPLAMIVASILLTRWFGLHRTKLNAYELQGMLESGTIAVALGLVGALVNFLPGHTIPEQTFIVLAMAYALMSAGFRLLLRWFLTGLYSKHQQRKRVLVYGAGQTGQQLAAALRTDHAFVPVAFVDDNPNLQGLTIGGLRVYPPTKVEELIRSELVERVVLAMPSASPATQAVISRRLRDAGCEVHAVPSFAELLVEGRVNDKSVPVIVNELLGRPAFNESLPGVNGAYHKRRVLVTGAGGSIGTELCRQLLATTPECLVLLDHSELALYNIDRELQAISTDCRIIPVLATVIDAPRMRKIMRDYKIDVVLHTAAYKHLPMVQANIAAGLSNNVFGTKVVAEAALEAGVERFILVSTDKAVRPKSAMGASKRMAELIVQGMAARSNKTRFSMVRFGNVLGSSGSVLPLFQDQINAGGPVTLTNKRATRYFMTVSEAVSLVLLAGTFARGGEVFVLNMGKPIQILRLARQMIRQAGYTVRDEKNPDGDIEIVEIGMRPGEKLHEQLLIGTDMLTTPHEKILRAQEASLSEAELSEMLDSLKAAIDAADDDAVQQVIDKWVTPKPGTVTILHEDQVPVEPPEEAGESAAFGGETQRG